jgi:hypothetical protein
MSHTRKRGSIAKVTYIPEWSFQSQNSKLAGQPRPRGKARQAQWTWICNRV